MQLLNAVPGERLHMNDLQYEMNGLVGISSQHFSQILMLLSYFGTSGNHHIYFFLLNSLLQVALEDSHVNKLIDV